MFFLSGLSPIYFFFIERLVQHNMRRKLHLFLRRAVCVFFLSGILFSSGSFIPHALASEPFPMNGPSIAEEWFDDALFIGDSLTGSLSNYLFYNDGLGKAKIIYVNGLACHHIINKDQQIMYAGVSYPIEEAVSASGCQKLYLMLAMNDVGQTIDSLWECWSIMIGRIQDLCPDVEIYIQSGTPFSWDVGYFTKENMLEYNEMLKKLCLEKGLVYVDVTSGLVDENGFLKLELQKDNCHMQNAGVELWIENLKNPDFYFSADDLEEALK